MTSWARLAGGTFLRYNFSSFPPDDHWLQADVWLPSHFFCPGPPATTGSSAFWISSSGYQRGLGATNFGSGWIYSSGFDNGGGPVPTLTPITVAMHFHSGTVDYYANGVLQFSETGVPFVGGNGFIEINTGTGCCCEVVYVTNVKVGSSEGAGDYFEDDFSTGFGNWFPQTTGVSPVLASIVSSPVDDACPTVTVTPTRGQDGVNIDITGSGFTPDSSLSLYWDGQDGGVPVEEFVATTDGSGGFTATIPLPGGIGTGSTDVPGNPVDPASPDTIYVYDAAQVFGCAEFYVCGPKHSDGITAQWDNPTDQVPTNLPEPLVAMGGTDDGSNTNQVLDYVFHDGFHWVLWEDGSALLNAGTFPPPTNHTLNATQISADGSTVTDYPLDTNYAWNFGSTGDDDPGLGDTWPGCGSPSPVWSRESYFSGWSKPVYDAHFASDGTNLWVAVLTAESVEYPWIDNKDAHGLNPGGAAQAIPLGFLTSGFTVFKTNSGPGDTYLRYYTNPTGPIDFFEDTAFPLTDAGIKGMGVWNPPVVVMFSFSGSGFTRIGEIDAKYCPSIIGQTDGYENVGGSIIGGIRIVNGAPRGALFSRVAIAASENDPGVCHVVWSEGGDWGRVADGTACSTGPFGGSRATWDAGPGNRSYRVNYTTWSPTGKLTDNDIAGSYQDRTFWFFTWSWDDYPTEFSTGYTWPAEDMFGAFINFDVRCDNAAGDVLLFVAPTTLINLPYEPSLGQPSPDPGGNTWDDFSMMFNDTLKVYDITGGTAVLKQTITPDLLPNEAEGDWAYPLTNPGNRTAIPPPPPTASDCLYAGPLFASSVSAGSKGFGISRIYDDPLLGGQPVYLVHVPWARRMPDVYNSGYGNYVMRAFYRVLADMSAPFEFLDGERQPDFTVLGSAGSGFASGDFFSDPDNIWVPSVREDGVLGNGADGFWFDRICKNVWEALTQAETPSNFTSHPTVTVGFAMCPGFYYDPAADSLSFVSALKSPYPDYPKLFAVTTLFICRGCNTCRCGNGINIARRF